MTLLEDSVSFQVIPFFFSVHKSSLKETVKPIHRSGIIVTKIIVQSLYNRIIIVQSYNQRLYDDCCTIVVKSLYNRTIVESPIVQRLYYCTTIVQQFLPENQ